MSKHLPPTAAKGKFPYPHRDLHQVAYDAYMRHPRARWRITFADWLATYHG